VTSSAGQGTARVQPPKRLRGSPRLPGDKSISHRSALLNAVADGAARVEGYSPGDDCRSTLECLKALGSNIRATDEGAGGLTLRIEGGGLHGFVEPHRILDAANSGTTARLLTGLSAGHPFLSLIDGDDSLRGRPMLRVVAPLRSMGASILGRCGGDRLPLAITGGYLQAREHHPEVASAQVKSALLLAGLYADGPTTVVETAATRDHTERMLRAQGVSVDQDGLAVTVWPPERLRAVDLLVPADPSAAAYWLTLACIHPDARVSLRGVGLNPGRRGLLDVLLAMGAKITISNERLQGGEPVGDLTAETSELRGVDVGGDLVPGLIDEVPLLAVAALFASGTTRVRDAGELRLKESDRLTATAAELNRFNGCVRELPDGLEIEGQRRPRWAEVDSHADHRLAMSLAVAGMAAAGAEIHGADAAAVSYPSFWNEARRLGAAL
jgi:3-phosphoshikimate 1-carboxyvinyltransferase